MSASTATSFCCWFCSCCFSKEEEKEPERKANAAVKLSLTGTFRVMDPSLISRSATARTEVTLLLLLLLSSFGFVDAGDGVVVVLLLLLFTDFNALYTNAMDCMRNSPYVCWPTALRRGVSFGQSATSVSTSSATSAMESQDDSGLAKNKLTRLTSCAATAERVALNSSNEDEAGGACSSFARPAFLCFSRLGEEAPFIVFAAGGFAASATCAFEHSSKTTAMASNVRDQFARKDELPSPVALNVLLLLLVLFSFSLSSSLLLLLPPSSSVVEGA